MRFVYHREWPSFTTPVSDTEDTSEEEKVGGCGFYSHGSTCLVHQHFVDQVVSAGGFNVHCTQGPESKHKLCMKLASFRVCHRDVGTTKSSMLHYLCLRSRFDDMREYVSVNNLPKLRTLTFGVRLPLCSMGSNFTSARIQGTILHREARVFQVELLDLLCDKFNLPKTRGSYRILKSLRYTIGQKLVRRDGSVWWATDTQFTGGDIHRRRRDILSIEGRENVGGQRNALCCEAVAFVSVSDFNSNVVLPADVRSEIDEHGNLDLILGRYFAPHENALQRDRQYRPICPGPLWINHCLWRYARASRDRSALVTVSGVPTNDYQRQSHLFGSTPAERSAAFQREKRAYFTLLSPCNILCRTNMTPCFVPGTSQLDVNTWLQTVTVL